MRARISLLAAVFLSSALAACGGDGGQGGTFKNGTGGGGGSAGPGPGAGAGGPTGPGSGAGTSTGTAGGGGAPHGGGLFQAAEPWNAPVDGVAKDAQSDAITQWLASHGGWGAGSFRIDFSIDVLTADASTPFQTFQKTGDFYSPDCDHVPFPVPQNGAIEGESAYSCDHDGDCHFIVVHTPSNKLYEMWRANMQGGTFYGGCTAVWDLTKPYPPNLRGDDCTSADAGGFPIAAMLFSADEVASGSIDHAIRFILPNDRIRNGVYAHPGTHSTNATSGTGDAPPYGVHLRLRADFPLDSLPSDGARVVAKGLQKYGMFLADGGNIALTASNDRFTQHKWSDVGVDSSSLASIQPTDMEVVDLGQLQPYTGDCHRNP